MSVSNLGSQILNFMRRPFIPMFINREANGQQDGISPLEPEAAQMVSSSRYSRVNGHTLRLSQTQTKESK